MTSPQRVAPHPAQVLADAVEDDDRVVGRVAGHRQDRGDDVQRHVVPEERQERERDQQVVNRRDDRADAEAELEPEREVQRGCRRATAPSPRRPLLLELRADRRADDFGARRLKFAEVALLERLLDLLRRRAQRRARLGADLSARGSSPALRRIAVRLDDRRSDRRPDSCGRAPRAPARPTTGLIELHDDHGAAGELDALRDALRGDHEDAGDDDHPRQRDARASASGGSRSWVFLKICMARWTASRPDDGARAPAQTASSTRRSR